MPLQRRYDPVVQVIADGPLLKEFRERIHHAKRKHALTWWGMGKLVRPPMSGSYLGNLARYGGSNVNTGFANGLRDLIELLEAHEPGARELDARLSGAPSSQQIIEAADKLRTAAENPEAQITIQDAVRALRGYGFEVVLTAR